MEGGEVNVTHARDSHQSSGIPVPVPPKPSSCSSSAFKLPQKRNSQQQQQQHSESTAVKPTTATATTTTMPTAVSQKKRKRPRSPPSSSAVCDSPSAERRATSKRRLTADASSATTTTLATYAARGGTRHAADAPSIAARKTPTSVRNGDHHAVKAPPGSATTTAAPKSDFVATPPPKVKSGAQKPPSVFRVPRDQPRRSSLSRSRTPARKMTIKQRPVFSTGGKLAAVRKLAGSVRAAAAAAATSASSRSRRSAAALKILNPNTGGHVAVSRRTSATNKSPKSTPTSGKQTATGSAVRDAAVFARGTRKDENDGDDGIDIYVPDEITLEFFHGKTFFVDGDCMEVVQFLWKLKARVASTFGDPNIWAFIGRANLLLADDGQQHLHRPTFKNENSRRMRAVVQTLNERKTNFQMAREHGIPLLDYDLVKQAITVLVPHVSLGAPNGAKMYHEPPFLMLCDTELEYKPEFKQFRPDGHDRSTLPTLYLDFSAPVMSPYLDNYPRDGRVVYLPPSGRKDVPRAGYCEICNRNYDDGMAQHIISEYHMHKLRRTDFTNLDNLFKAVDAEHGRVSSIFDVPPESPPTDSDEQFSSSSSSPISREIELEMCATPKLTIKRPASLLPPPPTTAASATTPRRGGGAFRSVVTPLSGVASSNTRRSPVLSESVNNVRRRMLNEGGVRSPSHGGDKDTASAAALVPRLRALSPASQSHERRQAPRAPPPSHFQYSPSARSNSHSGADVRVGTAEEEVPQSIRHHRSQLSLAPSDAAVSRPRHDTPGAPSSSNNQGVTPSANGAPSAALARNDQNVFLPGNLFTGTSSEHLRPLYDLEPPSNVLWTHDRDTAVAKAPHPSCRTELSEAAHQHARGEHAQSVGNGDKLATRLSAGGGAPAHPHGPVESLLDSNVYNNLHVHATAAPMRTSSSSPRENGQRKSARKTSSQTDTIAQQKEASEAQKDTAEDDDGGHQEGLNSSRRCRSKKSPCPLPMLPPTAATRSHAVADSRLSPLMPGVHTRSHNRPSAYLKSPSNNATSSSFPSPPSLVSIKRKKSSPLPSIMQSGGSKRNRRAQHVPSAGVLRQRDKNTLFAPRTSLSTPVRNPPRPSLMAKHSSHLKFSSSSPTGFYSKSIAPSLSPTSSTTYALPRTLSRQQNTPAAPVFHANLPSSSSVFTPPHVQFPNAGGAAPKSTPKSAGDGGASSSDLAFPLNTMHHHQQFTSSPVFAEALLSDDGDGGGGGSKGSRHCQSGGVHLGTPSFSRNFGRGSDRSSSVAPLRSRPRRSFSTDTFFAPEQHLDSARDCASAAPSYPSDSTMSFGRERSSSAAAQICVRPAAGSVADENTLPDVFTSGCADADYVPPLLANGVETTAAVADPAHHRGLSQYHSQPFKVVSSSSSSGLVSPQHRKKRRRKDNRLLFRSSSVDARDDGGDDGAPECDDDGGDDGAHECATTGGGGGGAGGGPTTMESADHKTEED